MIKKSQSQHLLSNKFSSLFLCHNWNMTSGWTKQQRWVFSHSRSRQLTELFRLGEMKTISLFFFRKKNFEVNVQYSQLQSKLSVTLAITYLTIKPLKINSWLFDSEKFPPTFSVKSFVYLSTYNTMNWFRESLHSNITKPFNAEHN